MQHMQKKTMLTLLYSNIWKCRGRYPERTNRSCTCGESGISKDAVNIRHTGKRCGYPGSVHGIPADWRMMVLARCSVTRKTIAFVRFRQEKDTIVTYQHLIISVQDIL